MAPGAGATDENQGHITNGIFKDGPAVGLLKHCFRVF